MAAGGSGRGHGDGVRETSSSVMEGLHPRPVKVWDRITDLDDTTGGDPVLRDLQKLATFNWGIDEDLMFIPGEPRIFTDKWAGGRLVVDSDVTAVLGKGQPLFPLEPAFRAVEVCSGAPIDLSQFDIVTTHKNLRQLFLFCDMGRDGGNDLPMDIFRMEVELIGNTVFLMYSAAASEPKPTRPSSYGLAFERACTLPSKHPCLQGMFKEVLSYRLGPLKLLVFSEVDCVIPVKDGGAIGQTRPAADDLLKEIGDLSVENPQPTPSHFAVDSPLQYVKLGSVPEPYKTVELATRRKDAKFRIEVFAKLLFAQMDFLYFGRHQYGNFDKPELLTIDQVVQRIGGVPSSSLWRLVSLLQKLVSYVRRVPVEQGYALIWFSKDKTTGKKNNRRLTLLQKDWDLEEGQHEPVLHALPELLRQKLLSYSCLDVMTESNLLSSSPWKTVGVPKKQKKLAQLPRMKPFGSREKEGEQRSSSVFGAAHPVQTSSRSDPEVEEKQSIAKKITQTCKKRL